MGILINAFITLVVIVVLIALIISAWGHVLVWFLIIPTVIVVAFAAFCVAAWIVAWIRDPEGTARSFREADLAAKRKAAAKEEAKARAAFEWNSRPR